MKYREPRSFSAYVLVRKLVVAVLVLLIIIAVYTGEVGSRYGKHDETIEPNDTQDVKNTEARYEEQKPAETSNPEIVLLSSVSVEPVHTAKTAADLRVLPYEAEPVDVVAGPESVEEPVRWYTEEDVVAFAQMGDGEAGGIPSDTEVAACFWGVCNRYDSGDPYYAGLNSLKAIIEQPGQFHGYDPNRQPSERRLRLARDVLERWSAEKNGAADVGRILPKEYMFWHGDGVHNYFTTVPGGWNAYDFSLPSPYES